MSDFSQDFFKILTNLGKRKDTTNYGGRISGDEKWRQVGVLIILKFKVIFNFCSTALFQERGEIGSCTTSPKRKQIVIRPNDKELAAGRLRWVLTGYSTVGQNSMCRGHCTL